MSFRLKNYYKNRENTRWIAIVSVLDIIKQLCVYKGVEIIESHLMLNHTYMLVSIPSKLSVFFTYGISKRKRRIDDIR